MKYPKGMYFKHGAFWLVRKNRWIRLGENEKASLDLYNQLRNGFDNKYIDGVFHRSKKNAFHREIQFELTRAEFDAVVRRSDGRCEVTGIPFTLANETKSKRRPFAPSLDRIDSERGYSPGNVRLVCICVNAALSDWGMPVLAAMLSGTRRRRVFTPAAIS